MRKITVLILSLSLVGCTTIPQPKQAAVKAPKAAKYSEPCPCSPTANQVVKKRWFSGFKVKLFH